MILLWNFMVTKQIQNQKQCYRSFFGFDCTFQLQQQQQQEEESGCHVFLPQLKILRAKNCKMATGIRGAKWIFCSVEICTKNLWKAQKAQNLWKMQREIELYLYVFGVQIGVIELVQWCSHTALSSLQQFELITSIRKK